MSQIASTLSASSEAFQANKAAMLDLLQRIQTYQQRTAAKSAQSRERFEKRGQLLPRERLTLLLDHGAPFIEFSALAGLGLDNSTSTKACRAAGSWPASVSCPGSGA